MTQAAGTNLGKTWKKPGWRSGSSQPRARTVKAQVQQRFQSEGGLEGNEGQRERELHPAEGQLVLHSFHRLFWNRLSWAPGQQEEAEEEA